MRDLLRENSACWIVPAMLLVLGAVTPARSPAKVPLNPVTKAARQFTKETGNPQAMHTISINGVPECSVASWPFAKWLEGRLPRGSAYNGEKVLDVRVGKLLLVRTVQPDYFDWLIEKSK